MPKSAKPSVVRRSKSLSSFGAAPLQHEASVFGGHTRAEAVGFCASTVVRLKSAFRHGDEFSLKNENGKTNLPLSLFQETETCLTPIERLILYEIDALPREGLGAIPRRSGVSVLFVGVP